MAKIIFRIRTVPAPSGTKDKDLQKRLEKAVSDTKKSVDRSKAGGVFESISINFIPGKKPRYKVILAFKRFS